MTGPAPNWIGYTLSGRYTIEALLGQGGMSAVYRAYDPNLRRTVAVKLIHSHLANDPQFVQRFEQEAGAVAALSHPNIVQVYDFNHDGDTYYMVMEYVEGDSLQRRLRVLHQIGERLPQALTLDLLATISDAVGFAHRRGLIHRDLKPANIMLNPAGQPVLMDFGVVKIIGGQQHTATGVVVGTPMYVAPELIRGRRPDARSDVYSLGVMLFEMLAGHPPFDADSAMTLMMKHVNEPVPDIRAERPDVSPALARIVERALAKDPDQRFQSAGEFASALRQGPQPTSVARPAATRTGVGVAAPTDVGPAPPAPPAPAFAAGGRRNLLLLGCGGLLVLAFLASAAAAAIAMSAALNPGRATATPTVTEVSAATATGTSPATASEAPSATVAAATHTVAPSATVASATNTAPPTDTRPAPTVVSTAPPTHTTAPPTWTQAATPTWTQAATATSPITNFQRAQITGISIVNDRYAVSFETIGYVADTASLHVHFFFNTVPPEQAGVPAPSSNWILHGAQPNPFTGYAVSDRPSAATEMCILVANHDHSVILGSGNCWPLP